MYVAADAAEGWGLGTLDLGFLLGALGGGGGRGVRMVYVCTYVHMYICTYVHTYIHTYIHTHIHAIT